MAHGGLWGCSRELPSLQTTLRAGLLSPSSTSWVNPTATPQGQGRLSQPLQKVLGRHPELSFVEKKPRLRVASHALLQNQPEGSGTVCCVESEFPLDKRVGLFSLSIRKVVQVSSFSQETAQGQRCAWQDHPQTPRLQSFGPDSWAFQKRPTAPVMCFCS